MDVSREHIEIVQGASGPKARIKGSRIRVIDVVDWYVKDGMSTEEIVESFPTISRADVHAALAYYWDNQEALDRKAAEDDAFVQAAMEEHERNNPSRFQELKRELEARWHQKAAQQHAADRQPTEAAEHVG